MRVLPSILSFLTTNRQINYARLRVFAGVCLFSLSFYMDRKDVSELLKGKNRSNSLNLA
jgi:hypothetical protein